MIATRVTEHTQQLLVILASLGLIVGCLLTASAQSENAVGWRTDGTGKYPDTTPVIEWSPDKNVIWTTPMPGFSNSTPVIVDDRLFVCAEPSTLVCVNLPDGKILWQRTNNMEDLPEAAEVPDMQQQHQRAAELRKQIGRAGAKLKQAKKDLQDSPDDAGLKTKVGEARKKLVALVKELQPYNQAWYSLPAVHPVNGFTSATPVSDGESVYVVFGTGMVACYDLEGNRLWGRVVEKPTIGYGHSASPLIVGDKLLVHLLNLTAIDKATGETLWQTKSKAGWGTPAVTRIGDTDVVITTQGDIVAVEDGSVLAKSVSKLTFCAPVIENDVVYFIEHGGKAIRLPETVDEAGLALETLWTTQPRKDRYYASPVIHEGLIYACTRAGFFSVIDAATGEVIYEQMLKLGKGTCYPSVTLAGGLLFISSDNGTTVVLKPGRTYQEVARNKLEQFRSSPVFIGDRLYIRGLKNLLCVAETDVE